MNKHMAQRKLTDVKKVISPPLLKCSLVNCRSVKKKESPSSILKKVHNSLCFITYITNTIKSNFPFHQIFVTWKNAM